MSEKSDFWAENEFAFVDVETTGSNPATDRIIEIAVMRVRGGEVVETWSTLVNPERQVPEFIVNYIGISNEMVADAPTFEQIADDLWELLAGAVFTAHNVGFDYAFLKHSFARAGKSFNQKRMCTVKLSRKLYSQHRRHSLDALIERFGFECEARHRAMGDVEVMWQFWQRIFGDFGEGAVKEAILLQTKGANLPSRILQEAVEKLEDTPGVYLFYGDEHLPLYVGKSVNLRSRVMSHFSGDYRNARSLKISQQIKRVEVLHSAGDLGARLKESQLIKKMQPLYNRQLRRNLALCSLVLERDEAGYDRVKIVREEELDFADLGSYFGIFKGKKAVVDFLQGVAKEAGLCLEKLGVEKGSEGGCFAYRMLKRCQGACCGIENPDQYNLRLLTVLMREKLHSWPFVGKIGIREENALNAITEIHVFENWCYLGTAGSQEEIWDLGEGQGDPVFDLDTYRIVRSFLRKGKGDVVEIGGNF